MSDYDGILLEDIDHKLDAILEGQQAMGSVPRQIDEIDTRLRGVESDVKTIKLVLKDHSGQIAEVKSDVKAIRTAVTNHDQRVTKLEKAAD
jgi:septal ring factor EnvC (AmiA/AmiB activator)